MMSEWWASETIIFMSGLLPATTTASPSVLLSCMTIFQTTNSICFMFPTGYQMAGATRVGNELGAGLSRAARIASATCAASAFVVSCGVAVVLLLVRRHWALIFTADVVVQSIVARLLLILSLYIVADGTQSGLTGTIKVFGHCTFFLFLPLSSSFFLFLPVSLVLSLSLSLSLSLFSHLTFLHQQPNRVLVDKLLEAQWCS
jgi:MATE family multidrug resistance protein